MESDMAHETANGSMCRQHVKHAASSWKQTNTQARQHTHDMRGEGSENFEDLIMVLSLQPLCPREGAQQIIHVVIIPYAHRIASLRRTSMLRTAHDGHSQ